MQNTELSSGHGKRKRGQSSKSTGGGNQATSKRQRPSEINDVNFIEHNENPERILRPIQGPLQAAEYALRGVGKVWMSDITLKRTRGSPQRPIYSSHVNKLATLMLNESIGVRRTLRENYIILSAPRAAIRQWEEANKVSLVKDCVVDVSNFFETTNCRFEVQDGQHRLSALQEVVRNIATDAQWEDESWRASRLWWTAYIFDLDTIDMWDLEFLRMNVSSHNKPDTEGDVWVKLDAMQAYANTLEVTLKSKWEDLGNRVLALNTVPRRFKEVYDGPWSKVVRSMLQYPAYHEGYYSNSLERVNVQRCRFFWRQFFEELESLLGGITCGQPNVLTIEAFDLFRQLKIPRSTDKIEALYGIELDPQRIIDRPQGFLSLLDDITYHKSATFASQESLSIQLPTWEEILRISKGFGDLVDLLCFHICKWISPDSMKEHQTAQRKPSVEEIWEDVLKDGRCEETRWTLHSFGQTVIKIARKHEKLFRKSEYKHYLARATINLGTESYRERFTCHPWVLLLEETIKVFGPLAHKHLSGYNISPSESPTTDISEDMAQTLTKTVKRLPYIDSNPSLDSDAFDDLHDKLKDTLLTWQLSWMERFLILSIRHEQGAALEHTRVVRTRLAVLRKAQNQHPAQNCRLSSFHTSSPSSESFSLPSGPAPSPPESPPPPDATSFSPSDTTASLRATPSPPKSPPSPSGTTISPRDQEDHAPSLSTPPPDTLVGVGAETPASHSRPPTSELGFEGSLNIDLPLVDSTACGTDFDHFFTGFISGGLEPEIWAPQLLPQLPLSNPVGNVQDLQVLANGALNVETAETSSESRYGLTNELPFNLSLEDFI